MAIEFFLKEDLVESTILDKDTRITIESSELKNRFLDDTNEWYEEEALELGVDEDDIMIYDPSVDISDERNKKMVKLCTLHFLKNIFFSLWKKKDDIYEIKLEKAEEAYDKLLSTMTPERIRGEKPAATKTTNSFATIRKNRGTV